MPLRLSFAFTSIGAGRSIGAHLHGGRALSRGATATLFDYLYDVIAGFFCADRGGGARPGWLLELGAVERDHIAAVQQRVHVAERRQHVQQADQMRAHYPGVNRR
jgi:hypothetical protein